VWCSANDSPSDALWRFALTSAISVTSFFFGGGAVVLRIWPFWGGVGAGLFPFLFLQGFEANIVLVAPHLIPEITMFSAMKLW
jgi:hypothetical protein